MLTTSSCCCRHKNTSMRIFYQNQQPTRIELPGLVHGIVKIIKIKLWINIITVVRLVLQHSYFLLPSFCCRRRCQYGTVAGGGVRRVMTAVAMSSQSRLAARPGIGCCKDQHLARGRTAMNSVHRQLRFVDRRASDLTGTYSRNSGILLIR